MLLLAVTMTSCYTLQQAYWFNNAYNSRVSVRDVLEGSPAQDPAAHRLHKKLALSQEILQFARREGLNTGSSYRHFIPESAAAVSYIVQAAYADRMEALTHWFPLVGRVPYLGFFDKDQRDAEAASLRAQGFDVSLGTVGAFSSLGWFDDPIYASMTKRSDPDFVQLLLHELVHRTFWSQGSVSFNENLAEFVSFQLAESFLKERRAGQGLEELRAEREDQERLRVWLQSLKSELEQLYHQQDIDRQAKLARKADIIEHFQEELFPKMITAAYSSAKGREWNNASILGASLYSPDTEQFRRTLDCVRPRSMGEFLKAIRRAEKSTATAEAALVSLCDQTHNLLRN